MTSPSSPGPATEAVAFSAPLIKDKIPVLTSARSSVLKATVSSPEALSISSYLAHAFSRASSANIPESISSITSSESAGSLEIII